MKIGELYYNDEKKFEIRDFGTTERPNCETEKDDHPCLPLLAKLTKPLFSARAAPTQFS